MQLPTVDTCCRCLTLEKGCLGIAIYGMVASLLQFIFNITNSTSSMGVTVITGILSVVTFGVAVALLLGIRQKKELLIRIWLIVSMVAVVIEFLILIYIIVLAASGSRTEEEIKEAVGLDDEPSLVADILGLIVDIALTIYFLLVVRSYRQRLMQESLEKPPMDYQAAGY